MQQKVIRKKFLTGMDPENLLVDNHFKENGKALQFVDIGAKANSVLKKQTNQLKIASWTNFN